MTSIERETRAAPRIPTAAAALAAALLLALGALPAAAQTAAQPAHATASAPALPGPQSMRKRPPPPPAHLVDINSASLAELKTLPGIGEAEAAKIVAHRPYLTKTELVSKEALPTGAYLSLKRYIVAMPKNMAKVKAPAKNAAKAPARSASAAARPASSPHP